jgi:enterochelin esterase-like enzyme
MRSLLLAWLLTFCVQAQTNRIISPEILPDGKVTFRLQAPKAAAATFFADWMDPTNKEAMIKNAEGLWSVTVGPVAPGIYIYSFTVDGLTIADPINPQIKLRARSSASLLEVRAKTPALWELRDVPHGTIEIQYHQAAALNNEPRQAWVYKPPGYDQSRKKYPVLYLLHGSNDTPAGWTMVGRAHYIMDNLLSEKKAREMIIVMPFGHAVEFGGREQSRNNVKMEEYVLKDLVPLIEKNYRVAKGRKDRAIVGLSMGGAQAVEIGLTRLDKFSAVGAFSSGSPRDFENRFSSLLKNSRDTNAKLKLLWIGCGLDDPAIRGSRNFDEALKKNQINHTFRELDGRHTYTVWRQCFSEVAPQLFK